jgi:hypothetical protein
LEQTSHPKREREKNFDLREEADVNEVYVQSSSNPMPTGERYGGKDLLLPFESRHCHHTQKYIALLKLVVVLRGAFNVACMKPHGCIKGVIIVS